jgi:hypothetical protein
MSKNPTTIKMVDWLEDVGYTDKEVAQELRRLHEVNAELLSALNTMLTEMGMDENEWNKPTYQQARDAIKKATGETE